MRIAVTTHGPTLSSIVDERFGRCEYVLLLDAQHAEQFEAVANPSIEDPAGAGIGMTSFLAGRNVQLVITGRVGPKAERALVTAGIATRFVSGLSAADAVKELVTPIKEESR